MILRSSHPIRYVSYEPTFWGSGAVCNVLTVLFTTYWRLTHFWFVHRMMHPWRTKWVPDLGKVLYKHVHSLHHKSYNPSTVWIGTDTPARTPRCTSRDLVNPWLVVGVCKEQLSQAMHLYLLTGVFLFTFRFLGHTLARPWEVNCMLVRCPEIYTCHHC
jgi:hypothetical protein